MVQRGRPLQEVNDFLGQQSSLAHAQAGISSDTRSTPPAARATVFLGYFDSDLDDRPRDPSIDLDAVMRRLR